jgi:hypothetical protein
MKFHEQRQFNASEEALPSQTNRSVIGAKFTFNVLPCLDLGQS